MRNTIKYHMFTDLLEDIVFNPRLDEEEKFYRVGFWYEMVRNVENDGLIEQLVYELREKKRQEEDQLKRLYNSGRRADSKGE